MADPILRPEIERLLSRIDERMTVLGIPSHRQISIRAGLGAEGLRGIRRGSMPGGRNLDRIAGALHCSTDYLLGRTDETGVPPPWGRRIPMAGEPMGVREDPILYDPTPRIQDLIDDLDRIDRATIRSLRELALDAPQAIKTVRLQDQRASVVRAALRRVLAQPAE
jgi:hypothetical protein